MLCMRLRGVWRKADAFIDGQRFADQQYRLKPPL